MTVDGKPVSSNILSPVPAGSTVQVKGRHGLITRLLLQRGCCTKEKQV